MPDLFVYNPDLPEITEDEKAMFNDMLENDRYLDLFIYEQTTNVTKFMALYHSFDKGKKGMWQDIADEGRRRGRIEYEEYVTMIMNGEAEEDVRAEVSESAFALIKKTVDVMNNFRMAGMPVTMEVKH